MVAVAQLVRAPACGAGGCRFKSDQPPHNMKQHCRYCGAVLVENNEGHLDCNSCGKTNYRNSSPSVCVVVTNDQGKVLLAKRDASSNNAGLWNLPGGFLENGELPQDGGKREVKEEVGLGIEVKEFLEFFVIRNPYGGENDFVLSNAFHGEVLSGEARPLHETEEVKWFKPDEIPWDKMAFEVNKSAIRKYFEIMRP